MAFVFKSEKGTNKLKNATRDIGPGEYLPQTDIKLIKLNKEPFLSSVKRNIIHANDVPGPGAYYQDETLINYLKNIQNEKISEQNDKVHLLAKGNNIELQTNSEKLGFLMKERRFKIEGNNNIPGPGFYFPKISQKKNFSIKKIENPIEINNKLEKIRRQEFSLIPTIPSKKQTHGFEITDNGDLIQKQDPDMYKTFTGEKGDTVGPGSYEIEKPNHWLRTGTEWSKFRTTRDSKGKKRENEKNMGDGLSMTTTRYSDSLGKTGFSAGKNLSEINEGMSKTMYNYNVKDKNQGIGDNNKKKNMNKNIMNCRIINVKENNRKKPIVKETFETVIKKNSPGPGYYYNQNTFSGFHKKQVPEYKQFFGSKLERFIKIKENSPLGPGTYFPTKPEFINKNNDNNDNNNKNNQEILPFKERMACTMEHFAPFNLRGERFQKRHGAKHFEVPGPGQYTIRGAFSATKDKNKKFYKTFTKFGSSERRFADRGNSKWQYDTPGPGSYLNQDTNSKIGKLTSYINLNNIYRGHVYNPNINNINHNGNIIINKKKVDIVPPVGLYHPEMIYTIDYNNRKKVVENNNIEGVAFDSGISKRNIDKKSTTGVNLGPGYYYKEKVIKGSQKFPPFSQSSKKWPDSSTEDMINGPGQYNLDSYFDWNKKTFNVNFV